MKRYRFILFALFSFFCFHINAQFFIRGNISFNTSSNKTEDGGTTTSKTSSFDLNLTPSVGYFLSERLAAGLALDLNLSGGATGVSDETKTSSFGIGATPFLRYYAMKWNKFSVFGQGNIGFNFSGSRISTNGTTTDGPNRSRYFVSVYPGLSYDVSENFSLETSINVLSFGYNYMVTKDGNDKDKSSNFYVGAGLNNIVSIGSVNIGAMYKF